MTAVDTNVLVYAHDPRDPAKQSTARGLIASLSDGVLLWQVACEYLAASRKLEPLGFNRAQVVQDIRSLYGAWMVATPTWSVLDRADRLMSSYSLSNWDALLIAACLEHGIDRLYSEDFSAYSVIDGLAIENPFRTSP